MNIKFVPPINQSIGECHLVLGKAMTVLELIDYLKTVLPEFGPILPTKISEETVRNRFLLFANGKLVGLEDVVIDQDLIEIISPMSGG